MCVHLILAMLFFFPTLVVVASLPNTPPVNEGTVLWTKDKTSIAKVKNMCTHAEHAHACIICAVTHIMTIWTSRSEPS